MATHLIITMRSGGQYRVELDPEQSASKTPQEAASIFYDGVFIENTVANMCLENLIVLMEHVETIEFF